MNTLNSEENTRANRWYTLAYLLNAFKTYVL